MKTKKEIRNEMQNLGVIRDTISAYPTESGRKVLPDIEAALKILGEQYKVAKANTVYWIDVYNDKVKVFTGEEGVVSGHKDIKTALDRFILSYKNDAQCYARNINRSLEAISVDKDYKERCDRLIKEAEEMRSQQ
jgi:hypothetical protein